MCINSFNPQDNPIKVGNINPILQLKQWRHKGRSNLHKAIQPINGRAGI